MVTGPRDGDAKGQSQGGEGEVRQGDQGLLGWQVGCFLCGAGMVDPGVMVGLAWCSGAEGGVIWRYGGCDIFSGDTWTVSDDFDGSHLMALM